MSITFDPQKWSNPLQQKDAESRGNFKGPVLVSLKDLNFFRQLEKSIQESFSIFMNVASQEDESEEPPPGGRKMRMMKNKKDR